MINIQHNALRAFEQNALTLDPRLLQTFPDNTCILQNITAHVHQIIKDLMRIHRFSAHRFEDHIMMPHQPFQFFLEQFRVIQITHANTAARYFIFISRADTTTRCTDLPLTPRRFQRPVSGLMNRQNQVGIFRQH